MIDRTQVKLEEELRQSREDLDRAQAVGHLGSWRLDIRENVLTWSDENYRIFGLPVGSPLTYETFLASRASRRPRPRRRAVAGGLARRALRHRAPSARGWAGQVGAREGVSRVRRVGPAARRLRHHPGRHRSPGCRRGAARERGRARQAAGAGAPGPRSPRLRQSGDLRRIAEGGGSERGRRVRRSSDRRNGRAGEPPLPRRARRAADHAARAAWRAAGRPSDGDAPAPVGRRHRRTHEHAGRARGRRGPRRCRPPSTWPSIVLPRRR